mgnify:FL=1|tara:strand:- start:498 stop:1355 length:858 start_codon:yes stop_codon:yes gene_type:complete
MTAVPPPIVPLASYPKSGNTWIRCLLTAWNNAGEVEGLGALVAPPMLSVRQQFDDYTGVASADLGLDDIDRLRPQFHHAVAEEMDGPLFLKVHDRFYRNRAGDPVFGADACRGVVHIVRHPCAVAASYAQHLHRPLDETIELMANEDALHDWRSDGIDTLLPQRIGSWSIHCASWLDQEEIPRLTLRYEDLVREPEVHFSALLEFAGEAADRDRAADAVEACRFEKLRDLEADRGFHEKPGDRPFFRRGQADGWRDELSEAQIERIFADHGAMMARLGYGRREVQ